MAPRKSVFEVWCPSYMMLQSCRLLKSMSKIITVHIKDYRSDRSHFSFMKEHYHYVVAPRSSTEFASTTNAEPTKMCHYIMCTSQIPTSLDAGYVRTLRNTFLKQNTGTSLNSLAPFSIYCS